MSASLDFMYSCPWVSPNHFQHEVGRQHVGFHTAKHKDRHLDAGPILPQIETVVPGISERPHDLRVEKHDVPLSARVPGHAVSRDVAPMFVAKRAKRR